MSDIQVGRQWADVLKFVVDQLVAVAKADDDIEDLRVTFLQGLESEDRSAVIASVLGIMSLKRARSKEIGPLEYNALLDVYERWPDTPENGNLRMLVFKATQVFGLPNEG